PQGSLLVTFEKLVDRLADARTSYKTRTMASYGLHESIILHKDGLSNYDCPSPVYGSRSPEVLDPF
ncbi:MAG TPA: hypothetical protein VEL31_08815, partial [Ktedonobacteraceae bacterium]|nr:hypothetical protein [Ktedonobacteraceae bacterium]